MKFDIQDLKTQAQATIDQVITNRSKAKDEAIARIKELELEVRGYSIAWDTYIRSLRGVVAEGGVFYDHHVAKHPKTVEDLMGGAWHLRDLECTASRGVRTEPPARLVRFLKFLEMAKEQTELSTNELKTHGWHNLQELLNPGSYK